MRQAELPEAYEHKTPGDIFLWVHCKRRELRMMIRKRRGPKRRPRPVAKASRAASNRR